MIVFYSGNTHAITGICYGAGDRNDVFARFAEKDNENLELNAIELSKSASIFRLVDHIVAFYNNFADTSTTPFYVIETTRILDNISMSTLLAYLKNLYLIVYEISWYKERYST